MRLRVTANLLRQLGSFQTGKYCATVASASWLTDAAYPLRVHAVFLRFGNFDLAQNLLLCLLAELRGAALKCGGILRGTVFF